MKTKTLLQPAVAVLSLFLFSCKGLEVAENRNFSNTKEIGVEWFVEGTVKNMGDDYERRLDSLMEVAMTAHNQKSSQLYFRKKEKKDKDYVTITLNNSRIVKPSGKAVGHALTGIGLLAAPAAVLVASQYTYVLAFYYWPMHRMEGIAELSPALAADHRYKTAAGANRGALFGSNKKQVPKLYTRYLTSMETVFSMIEQHLAANGSKSQE